MFNLIALVGCVATYIASFRKDFSKEHLTRLTSAIVAVSIVVIAIAVVVSII